MRPKTAPHSAVFDTNIAIAALIFGRRPLWLRRAWAGGSAVPIVCRETVAVLFGVVTYPKFGLNAAEREALVDRLSAIPRDRVASGPVARPSGRMP